MPVREVVLDRDIRSPFDLSASLVLNRYYARRAASVAVLATCDLLAVMAAGLGGPLVWGDLLGLRVYAPTGADVFFAALVTVVVAAACGLYGRRSRRHRVLAILNGAFAALLVLAVLLVATDHPMRAPSLLLYWLLGAAVAFVLRRGYDVVVALAIGEDLDAQRLLVVGSAADAPRIRAALCAADPSRRFSLAGTLGGDELPALEERCEALWPSQIVVADLEGARPHMRRLLDVCRRRHIPLKVSFAGLADDGGLAFLPGFSEPLFTVRDTSVRRRYFLVKRVGDVCGAGLAVVLLSPVLLALALLVKCTSKGSAFFASRRVGLGQKVFPCYKFRTMCVDAEDRQADLEHLNEMEGCLFKIAADPRVTRVGGFLRRHSLDELPQLINVLRGEMSMVGPRPLPVRDVELMADWEKRRHVVLPGITGLWQVNGRADLDFDDMMELDARYIETWSLHGDLAVLVRTAGAVFARKGAY